MSKLLLWSLIAPAASAASTGWVTVPGDFSTIQEAIDRSSSTRVIVAPGRHAGAVVRRPVRLESEGATIVSGPAYDGIHVGFALTGEADNTQIVGFSFDCAAVGLDVGVYASASRFGAAPDGVVVHGNRFQSCVQGVTNAGHATEECAPRKVDGGQDWRIENNSFEGFRSVADSGRPIGGIGIYLFNASFVDVVGNRFFGRVQDTRDFTTSGVMIAGCWDCVVADNGFAVSGGTSWWSAVSNMGFAQAGAAASQRVLIVDNDAHADSAPNWGINYRSYDSFDTDFSGSRGVGFVDHSVCGDGRLETFERR